MESVLIRTLSKKAFSSVQARLYRALEPKALILRVLMIRDPAIPYEIVILPTFPHTVKTRGRLDNSVLALSSALY